MPTSINQAASEAYACYSIGSYRAAALLARTVIEAVAKDKGITSGSLVSKINQLRKADLLTANLTEAAHDIRLTGNDIAHGDLSIPISEEDCDDLLDFMSSILEEIYQRPANLARRKAQREARKTRTP